jgi:glycosyltransferase involved in cell wall biosynthesis
VRIASLICANQFDESDGAIVRGDPAGVDASMMVSVAICTWNRARLLEQTLAAMRKLVIPQGLEWELLVVNNNGTDDTDDVLRAFEGVLPLHWWREPQPGKSHAANSAIGKARGDLLVWTDDDVLVDPQWLAEYVRAANEWTGAQFFGGVVEPWFDGDPPGWVVRHHRGLRHVFALTENDTRQRELGPSEMPIGANMAVRTSVQRNFLFNTRISNVRGNPIGGEENDLFRRLRAAGHTGVWVGGARVRHFVPRSRMTVDYVRRWSAGRGRADARLGDFTAAARLWGAPRWIWRQWLEATAVEYISWPAGGATWLRALQRAARLRGMIDELSGAAGKTV